MEPRGGYSLTPEFDETTRRKRSNRARVGPIAPGAVLPRWLAMVPLNSPSVGGEASSGLSSSRTCSTPIRVDYLRRWCSSTLRSFRRVEDQDLDYLVSIFLVSYVFYIQSHEMLIYIFLFLSFLFIFNLLVFLFIFLF